MKHITILSKPLWWVLSLLALALIAGCSGSSSGGSGVSTATSKEMTAYSISGVAGTINETAKTISVALPYGSNVTALVATYTSNGNAVKVGGATQTSGSTQNNFSSPLAYTVSAEDASAAIYTVTVTVSVNTAKSITEFKVAGVEGTINETAKTIAVNVPYGTNVGALAAAFTSTGSNVKVALQTQTSGVTLNDFSAPVAYLVTAPDNSTVTYTVTVSVALNFAKSITAYSLAGVTGIVNETTKAISVTMPSGTNVTALIATFTSTGSGSAKVGGVSQVSGVTPNDFTNAVSYTVSAANASTASYTVTVTVAHNAAKALTVYSLASVTGTIDETAKTIAVVMPGGTGVTALVATFSTTGTGVKIGSVVQTSGVTANDFTSPQVYTVTAADTTTANYTTTVSFAPGPVVCSGAACVPLGTSSNYAIFGTSGITNVPASIITGDLGSAAASGTITGFVKTLDAGGAYSTDPQVAGKIYAFDYAVPTPSAMTSASNDIVTAYGLAAGRTGGIACPGAGDFSGLTLPAGVYTCSVNVILPTNLVLNGSATDVWVFQFSGTLTQSANMQLQLTGGALRQNVFWQVAGAVQIGTGALMQGVILGATNIDVLTGATVNGRLLAQTAVNLQSATVTQP